MQKPIYVTQIDLQQIWDKKILTNGGPLHKQLDQDMGKVPTLVVYQPSRRIGDGSKVAMGMCVSNVRNNP